MKNEQKKAVTNFKQIHTLFEAPSMYSPLHFDKSGDTPISKGFNKTSYSGILALISYMCDRKTGGQCGLYNFS